jgi:hypothetical protein
MIKKFLSKYLLEVIPSIVATVVGAYIVTHYINAKPDAGKPPAAVSSPAPAEALLSPPNKSDAAAAAKAEAAAKSAAKAAAERAAASEKAAAAKAVAEKAAAEKVASEKEAARKAERLASEKREAEKREAERHEAEKREHERALAKAAPAAKPSLDAKPVMESAVTPDANDLARAAIARLRAEQPVAGPAVKKMPEQPVAPVIATPASQPAAVPATPAPAPMREAVVVPTEPAPPAAVMPLPTASIDTAPPVADVNASRLVPPADIPSRPVDLRPKDDDSSVASDMMSAAKSAFQSVLPR